MNAAFKQALLIIAVAAVLALAAAGCSPRSKPAGIQFPHIHGLGFTADGGRLLLAAHDGLRVFADDGWSNPDLPRHDYMGFTVTDDGFYSSGHPAPGSGLKNPLGLVRSADEGKSLTTLGFAGEHDFHVMGAGYFSHAIWVFNPAASARLPAGIHFSLDDARTWSAAALQGLMGESIVQMAVHATDPATVAIATDAGVYLSTDAGRTFARVGPADLFTAVAFHPHGEQLLLARDRLLVWERRSGQVQTPGGPPLAEKDAIAYVAANPARPAEIAVATFGRNVWLSTDGGQSWTAIATNGVTIDPAGGR